MDAWSSRRRTRNCSLLKTVSQSRRYTAYSPTCSLTWGQREDIITGAIPPTPRGTLPKYYGVPINQHQGVVLANNRLQKSDFKHPVFLLLAIRAKDLHTWGRIQSSGQPVGTSMTHVTARTDVKGEPKLTATNGANVLCTTPWLSLLLCPAHDSYEKHLQTPGDKPGE